MDNKTRLKASNEILQALRSCFDTEARLAKVVEENIGKAHERGTYIFDKKFDQMLLALTRTLKGGPDPRVELANGIASAIAEAKDVLKSELPSQPGRKLVH